MKLTPAQREAVQIAADGYRDSIREQREYVKSLRARELLTEYELKLWANADAALLKVLNGLESLL